MKVQFDERIRLTSTVLLLTKFRDLNAKWKLHDLKVDSLRHLEQFADHPCAQAARAIAENNFMWHFYQYAVCPEELARLAGEEPEDFRRHNFGSLIQDFARDTQIASLWQNQAQLWASVQSDCQASLESIRAEELLRRLFGPPPAELVVVPTPLDPATMGFCVRDRNAWYALVGPPNISIEDDKPVSYLENKSMLRLVCIHEFTHFFWKDAQNKCPSFVDMTQQFKDRIEPTGYFKDSYPYVAIRFEEILVRASVALCVCFAEGDQAGRDVLADEVRDYNIDLIHPVYDWLKDKHTQHGQLPTELLGELLPDLIASLS